MKVRNLIWAIIAATGAVDFMLLVAQGMTVREGWAPILGVIFLCGVSLAYRLRIPAIASTSLSVAQLAAFSHVGAILSYVAMAASPFPMADALLSQADAALGFRWLEWFNFVNAHPTLHLVLALAYASIPVQGLGLLFYFSYADSRRVHEFLLAMMLSVIIITPIMVLLPSAGAWSQHGVGTEPWLVDILSLRSHSLTVIVLAKAEGIISFPSFHTVLGVLLANMARGYRWFPPIAILNLVMLASVFSEGAHYGVDMLGGIAVAFVALAATRFLLSLCSHNGAPVLRVYVRPTPLTPAGDVRLLD